MEATACFSPLVGKFDELNSGVAQWLDLPRRSASVSPSFYLITAPTWASNRIYSVRTDGSGLRIEVDSGLFEKGTKYTAPNVSPDGRRLVFDLMPTSNNDYNRSRLIVVDLDGDSKGDLEDLDYGKSPRWSPDGKQITFAVHAGNPKEFEPGVWVMNADGTNAVRVGDGAWPHWTRDGQSLGSTTNEVRGAK
jgi:Tol biopolymer transport system component